MHFLPAVLAFSPAPRPGLGAAPRAGIVKAVNQRQNEFCYGLPVRCAAQRCRTVAPSEP
jgi:hypothetical protein